MSFLNNPLGLLAYAASSDPTTPNRRGRPPHRTIVGRRTPESRAPSFLLEASPSRETTLLTGTRFWSLRNPVTSQVSRPIFSLGAIARSSLLPRYYIGLLNIKIRIIWYLGELYEQYMCTGGRTGTGKSRRAWDLAGFGSYPKDPCTKFWDGYQPSNPRTSTLSLMNSEERLTYLMSCAGATAIPLLLRQSTEPAR